MSNCPFNYSGSKSAYTDLHEYEGPVVDLFGGGGGFWSNVKSKKLYVNDCNESLISFQKLIYKLTDANFEKLVEKMYEITSAINSREEYEALRGLFNMSGNPIQFYALLSCCTNNMIRYNKSGGFNQTWGKRKFNPNMERKLRSFRSRIIDKDITFFHGDFIEVQNYGKDCVYFVDPPYLISGNLYGGWNESDERKLYDYLRNKTFVLTNYIHRGNLTNDILQNYITDHNWHMCILRTGKMRAQKDDSSFTEVIVCDSFNTMSLFVNKLV